MKKQILKTICLLLFANLAVAQKGNSKKNNISNGKQFYIGASGGYNFAAGANTNNLYSSQELTPTTSITKSIYASNGKGINFSLQGGYLFNKYFGTELGLNYFFGTITKTDNTELNGNYFKNVEISKIFQIKPGIIILAGYETINPYAKFGLIVAKGSINFENNSFDGIDKKTQIFQLYGGYAVGLTASAGTNYKINDKISLFGEVVFTKLSYQPSKGTLLELTKNGTDILLTKSVSEREIELSDSFVAIRGVVADPNKPAQALPLNRNFGSLGLNFGINYNF